MNMADLQDKSVDTLRSELLDMRKEQFNLRMQHRTGQLAQHDQLAKTRKSIARVKTVLNQKLRAEADGQSAKS